MRAALTLVIGIALAPCGPGPSESSRVPPEPSPVGPASDPAWDSGATTTEAKVLVQPFARPEMQPELVGLAPSDESVEPVEFAWSAPCRVPARHFESNNDGGSTILELVLDLGVDGDGIELRFDALRVEMLADVRIEQRAAARERAVLHAATLGSLPTRRVGKGGEDLGPGDTQGAIERAVAKLEPDDASALHTALRAQEIERSREVAGRRLVRSLIGEWRGFSAGLVEASTRWKGIELPQAGERRNLGRLAADPDLVLLEVERRLEGPQFVAAVMKAATARAKAEGREPPPAEAMVDARRTELIAAALDPTNGWPHHVLYQSVFVVNDKQQVEVEEWSFDWARAEGCGSDTP